MINTSILTLSGITKKFGPVVANDKISFDLAKGEIVALLGENGAGKTTLMSILFGHYVADEGHVTVFGKKLEKGSPKAALEAGIGMVHQHFTLAGNMSVLDNIILGTESLLSLRSDRTGAENKISTLMKRFGLMVDPNSLVKKLSVGEQQRVEILKVLYRDAKILILDEPTAVLTPQESDALFKTIDNLVNEGLSVIFITHKMREVMASCHRCIVLRHGKVVFETLTENTDPKALARAMVGDEIMVLEREKRSFGKEVLSLVDISVTDPDGKKSLKGVNLHLKSGQILGIAGVSGNGQAQLADMISGLTRSFEGDIILNSRTLKNITPQRMIQEGVGRVPDDRNGTGVISEMSVMENMTSETYKCKPFSVKGSLCFTAIASHAQKLVKKFDVRCPDIHTPVRKLSGGNIQKLILARELSGSAKVIIVNQPTWGLDVGATSYVHRQLVKAAKDGAGIIIISEDMDELFELSDNMQVMYHGGISDPEPVTTLDRTRLGLIMSGQILSGSMEKTDAA